MVCGIKLIKVPNFRIFLKKKDSIIYKDIEQRRGKKEERKRKKEDEKKKKRKTVYITIDILHILSSILCILYILFYTHNILCFTTTWPTKLLLLLSYYTQKERISLKKFRGFLVLNAENYT